MYSTAGVKLSTSAALALEKINSPNTSTESSILYRDAESLFFAGLTPTPVLTNLASDWGPKLRLRL